MEMTLTALLDAEADRLSQSSRHDSASRRSKSSLGRIARGWRADTEETDQPPSILRKTKFEDLLLDRYRRHETSIEEALLEMYYMGVPVRRVEEYARKMWGTELDPTMVGVLKEKIAGQIETWRQRPIQGSHAYVFVDGIWLKRHWGGAVKYVNLLVAVGVNRDGYLEVLGVTEGTKNDTSSWLDFIQNLMSRGLPSPRLIIGDKCLGLAAALTRIYPQAAFQRCVTHFYQNVWSLVPPSKLQLVATMLKAIHASEDIAAARQKASQVIEKLRELSLPAAGSMVAGNVEETLSYYAFPREHHRCLRMNNPLNHIMREIRRRARLMGPFSDGTSALLLMCARLRHMADKSWSSRRYLDMDLLGPVLEPEIFAGGL